MEMLPVWISAFLLALFCVVTSGQGVNVSVLQPETLSDSLGNRADAYSNISYVPVRDDQTYKAQGKQSGDVGPISALYDLASSLCSTSLPGEFPYEWIMKFKNGNIDIGNDWKTLAVDYLGYVIAIVFGLVFVVVFPIVGLCCCCCRCCGKCGGSRVIQSPSQAGQGNVCGRRTAIGLLAVFSLLSATGCILMFVTNGNVTSSLADIRDHDIDKLDDVSDFFDSTIGQAERFILGNFNFTLDVLFRDLDNIGFLLGTLIRDQVLTATGLGQTYDEIDDLDTDAVSLRDSLQQLVTHRKLVLNSSAEFHNFTLRMKQTLDSLAANYPNFNTAVPATDRAAIVTGFNASRLPEETMKLIALNASVSQGIRSMTAESRNNLQQIPERVQNQTAIERTDLKTQVNSYTGDVSKVINDLKKMRDDVLGAIDFNSLKGDGKRYLDTAKEYDQYRWYAGLGLAGVMSLASVLLVLGLSLGSLSGNAALDPTQRSGVSNAGGHLLLGAVVVTFLFGWLVMLTTTILFAAGAPADRFGCRAINDLSVLDKLLDDYHLLDDSVGNGTWLGNKIFSGKNVRLKISELMESCKKGEAIYVALQMEKANIFNLTDLTDYKKKFNIEDKLSNINVNFDSINITSGPMSTFIGILKDFDKEMDYLTYNTTFLIDPVLPSKYLLDNLTKYYNSLTASQSQEKSNVASALQELQDVFDTTKAGTGAALNTSVNIMKNALLSIMKITQHPTNNTLSDRCDKLNSSLIKNEQNLTQDASRAFNDSVKVYQARLLHIMDSFVASLKKSIQTELGVCLPVWNLFSDVLINSVCRSTVGALGGWWSSTGWTVVTLTVSLVISIKLSRHFLRMRFAPEKAKVLQSPPKAHHFKNKVFHNDKEHGLN